MLERVLNAGAHRLVDHGRAAIHAHMIEVTVNHNLTVEVHVVFGAILFLALWEQWLSLSITSLILLLALLYRVLILAL